MKKLFFGVLLLVVLCSVLPSSLQAQDRGEATLTLGTGKVSVDYGRPSLQGRDIYSLIKPGDEWRMGSNAPTTLTTDIDLKFGDKMVKKGKYVLRAKLVEKGKWVLLIKQDDTVVAEVPLVYSQSSSPEEQVTIKLEKQGDGGKFLLQWGTFTASTNFKKA
ncbi:MAG TPA: DUF2911 domain-containing protein [Terriglobia bacterium]|nr:DUF2911 domain-containing protein [Terriglobia bacterium]